MNRILAALAGLLVLASPAFASAFCGFYVSGADAKLFADATQVVLMREGTRTVLSMQNDYKGPPADFAMVIPVPVVLQKENVKTLPHEVFGRVDKLASPRLVEYWEQDPCSPNEGLIGLLNTGAGGGGMGFGSGSGRLGGAVRIEAQFEVGEYEVVILSAQDSSSLDTWLRENKYKIPEKAEPALRPYVAAGSKFFVAKVNVAKVAFDKEGRATLSPLRFHYDTDKFELPVKLGMLNSGGTQDLIVHILAPNQRYIVANYPNATIPTNIDVAEAARPSFGAFYAALFDKTVEKNPGAVITEYAWGASNCDPCPGGSAGLQNNDLATLGADVLPSAISGPVSATPPSVRQGDVTVSAGLPKEVVQRIARQNFGRYRLCYEQGLRQNPALAGKVTTKFTIGAKGEVTSAANSGSTMSDASVVACIVRAFQNLSFPTPENTSKVDVTYTLDFSPPSGGGGGSAGSGSGGLGGLGGLGRIGTTSIGSGFVLTRLHVRYNKDALGNDLVFKAADPIVGGREVRGEKGELETGAKKDTANNFQGRYAIRHPWPFSITCEKPKRGVWGGPWPKKLPDGGEANWGEPKGTIAATKTAYAPRNLILASYTPKGIPELNLLPGTIPPPPLDSAAPEPSSAPAETDAATNATDADGGTTTTPKKSSCGCDVIGARDENAARGVSPNRVVGLLAIALLLERARRGRRKR